MRYHVRKARQYNYFRVKAVENLLELLGVEHPDPQQIELANRFVENVSHFTRSKIGH